MLKVKNLKTSYGHIHALKGINLDVEQGEIVTLIGSNGAGKTTTLMSIMGMLKSEPGSIVEFEGEDITHCSPVRFGEKRTLSGTGGPRSISEAFRT